VFDAVHPKKKKKKIYKHSIWYYSIYIEFSIKSQLISSLAIHSKVETGEGKSESGYHQIVVTLAMQEEERIPSVWGEMFSTVCVYFTYSCI
jgi:hypothetical protein